MNELNIYQFFEDILSKSKVIEGRFHVLPGYSNDLNSDNFSKIFEDALGGIKDPRKYPIAFMFPPVELVSDYENGFSEYKIQMFFMTQPHQSSSGMQNADFNKNISKHTIEQTWKDMGTCAKDFMSVFDMLSESPFVESPIKRNSRNKDIYSRYSRVGNDNLSGQGVDFEIIVFNDCEIEDYDLSDFDDFKVNTNNLHPTHKM